MIGFGLGIGKNRYWGSGGPSFTSTIFVSNSGNDANNGLTSATAKETIAGIPLESGMRIMLARGSVWHEELNLEGLTEVQIDAYGVGQIPVLDASDPVAGTWVVDGVEPNVYNLTLAHDGGDGLYLSLWEDGIRP